MAFTKKDVQIIKHLRENSRITMTDLSKKTNIPLSTIHGKMAKLEQNLRHTTLLDFNSLGYYSRNTIIMKVKENHKELKEFLQNNTHVNNLYEINNGYDFMVETICISKIHFKEILNDLMTKFNFEDLKIFEIINDKKREAFEL